jgi:hypothetical protein
VPRSGLAKSLISGPRIMFMYSSGETFFPNCRTKGTIVAAEAPPYSSAVTREGRMRKEANSGGNEEVDSLSVLRSWSMNKALRTTRHCFHLPKKCDFLRFAAQAEVVEPGTHLHQSIAGEKSRTFTSRLCHSGVQECFRCHATLRIRIEEFLETRKHGRRNRATRRRLRRRMRGIRGL